MPFVQWEDKYLLGIDQFDEHHKHLVDLMNEVYEMLLSGESEEGELHRILDSLARYATYHFSLEETWMRQLNYPKQDEHILEHKKFIYKLFDLNKRFREDTSYLTLEIVSFLRGWLLDHILNTDAEYGAFVSKRPRPR